MKRTGTVLSLLFLFLFLCLPVRTAYADDTSKEVLPTGVQLSETSVTKNIGDVFQLAALVTPDDSTDKTVTWSCSNPAVATVAADGTIQCLSEGSAVITTATVNGFSASCELKVLQVGAQGITLPKTMCVGLNETRPVEVTFIPNNTTNKTLIWSSSNKKIATVNNGLVTGIRKGSATITAALPSGLKATCKVKVTEIPAACITVNIANYTGKSGDSFSLQAEISPANTSNKKICWSSSNKKVAKVSSNGVVTLIRPGYADITAKTNSGKKAVCKVQCISKFNSAHYCQGDKQWKFPRKVRKLACTVSSFAIMLQNAGVPATPRTVYNVCSSTSLHYDELCKKFGITTVNALTDNSPYLKSFNGNETFIANPEKNYIVALKEALDRNPEGVCVYFEKGNDAHMVVAIGYIGDTIYYSDPGRAYSKGYEVSFSGTWSSYKHKMSYKNVSYLIAIDVQR